MQRSSASPAAILKAKLTQPQCPLDLVERSRLIARLTDGLDRRLTLVSAPAGYGKTTTIADWVSGLDQPSAWLSLEPLDNNLSTFGDLLVAAVRQVYPGFGEQFGHLFAAAQEIIPRIAADALIEDLATLPGQLVLVLDDFHAIDDAGVLAIVERLLQYMPSNIHLVLCTRVDPRLSLARLRARREMTEIRVDDLRLNAGEVRSLLSGLTGTPFDAESGARVEEETEGWAVAVQLAGLAMREGESAASLVDRLSRIKSAYTTSYLLEEVFSVLPVAVQDFLVHTSILERLSEPLCAAVSGLPEQGDFLIQLWRANQLIVPLDDNLVWFRYHTLFRHFLRQRLAHSTPPEEIRDLHRRAAHWLERHGMVGEAIAHALDADDTDLAVQVLEDNLHPAMNRDEWWRIARWLELLPQTADAEPVVWIARGWLAASNSQVASMLEAATHATMQLNASNLSSEKRHLIQAQIDTLQSVVDYWKGDGATSLEMARHGVAHLPPEMSWARGVAYLYEAMARFAVGDPVAALERLQARMDSEAVTRDDLGARMAMGQCLINLELGEMLALRRTGAVMERLANRSKLRNSIVWSTYVEGFVAYEWNDLGRAEHCLRRVTAAPHSCNLRCAYESFLLLALVLEAQARPVEADEVIRQLEEFLLVSASLQAMPLVEAIEQQLALGRGKTGDLGRMESPTAQVAVGDLRLSLRLSSRLARVRCLIREATPAALEEAGVTLDALRNTAGALGLRRRMVEILALQALAAAARGDEVQARGLLRQSLQLGGPGQLLRTYVDCGEALVPLLKQLLAEGYAQSQIGRILGAFTSEAATSATGPTIASLDAALRLEAALTLREREVLELLAERFSNKEIAARLFITPDTVKKYTRNIYVKLGVNNRRAAVSLAVRLGLLPAP